jgi:hypothetical protein
MRNAQWLVIITVRRYLEDGDEDNYQDDVDDVSLFGDSTTSSVVMYLFAELTANSACNARMFHLNYISFHTSTLNTHLNVQHK